MLIGDHLPKISAALLLQTEEVLLSMAPWLIAWTDEVRACTRTYDSDNRMYIVDLPRDVIGQILLALEKARLRSRNMPQLDALVETWSDIAVARASAEDEFVAVHRHVA
jgi:hypothetical protein